MFRKIERRTQREDTSCPTLRGVPAHPDPERDEPVVLPLDPEEALRALLQVKPDDEEPVADPKPDR